MKIARIFRASLFSLLLTAQSVSAADDFVLPEYGDPITLPGVVPDPVPEAIRPAVEAYEAGDYETARTLFTPAAEEGAPVALYFMGLMHRYGRGGLEVDSERGYALLERAAEAAAAATPQDGYIYRRSLYSMGFMNLSGQLGDNSDQQVGECLITLSSEFGYSTAQFTLSDIVNDFSANTGSSLELENRSVLQGNLTALKYVGLLRSINPVKSVNPKGFMFLHLAALGGHPEARSLMKRAAALRDKEVNSQIQIGIVMSEKWRATPEEPPSVFHETFLDC